MLTLLTEANDKQLQVFKVKSLSKDSAKGAYGSLIRFLRMSATFYVVTLSHLKG